MRAAVTGGAGFIGSHLVHELLRQGHQVSVIDDLSTGRLSRLAGVENEVRFVDGTVLDPNALDVVLPGCDVVFHEAAIASVARSLEAPRLSNEVNVGGTIEVMAAAGRHGVRRVILASSAAVYGIPETLPCREDLLPAPTSPYGAGKLAAEHYLHSLGASLEVETVALRYFNVYGPGQDPRSEYAAVVPRFVTAVLDREAPTIYGSADISRDFVYISDVVQANLLAARPEVKSRLTCNVASGRATTLRGLLDAVGSAAGTAVQPVFAPPRQGDIHRSVADVGLARDAMSFEASTRIDRGIAATVEWFRMQRAA